MKRDDDSGKKGTLHDQRIFGPRQDNRCACGKYEGQQFQGMICDRCGVKVGPSSLRGTRFAHIGFPHPLSEYDSIACFPVLPARYFGAAAGKPLFGLYEELIDVVNQDAANSIRWALGAISDLLLPVLLFTHGWQFTDAPLLANGLALELKHEAATYCRSCGYLLAGSDSTTCAGCGDDRSESSA